MQSRRQCRLAAQARVSLSRRRRPPIIDKSNLGEIEFSKACTGAFMRIKAVHVRNEFDIWQPYEADAPINNLSLYIVEANSFDLFFNNRYKPVLRLLPEATEATTRDQGREAPEHHQ